MAFDHCVLLWTGPCFDSIRLRGSITILSSRHLNHLLYFLYPKHIYISKFALRVDIGLVIYEILTHSQALLSCCS